MESVIDPPNEYTLPGDYVIHKVTTALSETVDYSNGLLGIRDLWSDTEGEDVTVAVLDTGCFNHPDLEGAIVDAKDFTRSAIGWDDFVQHGTWCAGFIGARANGVGVIGVAPKCKLLIGKVLNDSGSGTRESIVAGLEWAAESGADIISLSLGGPSMGEHARQVYARIGSAKDKYLFAAAGNSGDPNQVDFPARWPESICVGAVDKDGKPTRFSNKGPRVDIWTYGVDMLSTIPRGYGTMSGTSMATPQAAAVAALALSYVRKRSGVIAGHEAMRKVMRDTAKNGIISPSDLIKAIGASPAQTRRKVLALGAMKIYTPALPTDDAGIVFDDDAAKAEFVTQMQSFGKTE